MAAFGLLGVRAPLHASSHAGRVRFFTETEATFRVLLERVVVSMPAMATMGRHSSAQLLQAVQGSTTSVIAIYSLDYFCSGYSYDPFLDQNYCCSSCIIMHLYLEVYFLKGLLLAG
jgi:hypothetical protein